MLEEDREIGKVSNKIYKLFFDYYGRYKFFFKVILGFLVIRFLSINLDFWVSTWANQYRDENLN